MARYVRRTCPQCGDYFGVVVNDSPKKSMIAAVNGLLKRCDHKFDWKVICVKHSSQRRIATRLIGLLIALIVASSLMACTEERKEERKTVEPTPLAPTRQEAAPVEPVKPKGEWTVQVRAYVQKAGASRLVNALRDKGYQAYAVEAVIKGQTWHRVRVGQLPTKQEAQALQGILKSKEGFSDAFVVRQKTENPS